MVRIDAAGRKSSSPFSQAREVVSAILEQRMPSVASAASRNPREGDEHLPQPPSTRALAREVLGSLRQGLKRVCGR